METTADDERDKIRQFMEIAGEPANQSRQFLEATAWHLEDAVQLYFAGGVDTGGVRVPPLIPMSTSATALHFIPAATAVPAGQAKSPTEPRETYVRPPLPVKREVLYEDISHFRSHRMAPTRAQPTSVDAFRNFEDEANQRVSSWDASNSSSSELGGMKDSLAALYRPPFVLMFQGTFEQAKEEAAKQAKWLLINLQSTKEFCSYTLNRDTWAHEAVKETVSMSFIFWQVYDDTEEGRKVCTYYKLLTIPTTLVLDPLTGQQMRAWEGMISPERLLEDLVPYLDRGPTERQSIAIPPQKRPREIVHWSGQVPREVKKSDLKEEHELRRGFADSLDSSKPSVLNAKESQGLLKVEKKLQLDAIQKLPKCVVTKWMELPTLPEEPEVNSNSICRVAVRFPDGRRAQRRFVPTDPIQYLWSFASYHEPEAADGRSFRLTQAIPGATPLDYSATTTIGEAGLGNSILAMTWD